MILLLNDDDDDNDELFLRNGSPKKDVKSYLQPAPSSQFLTMETFDTQKKRFEALQNLDSGFD